jgi:hypothetical protein
LAISRPGWAAPTTASGTSGPARSGAAAPAPSPRRHGADRQHARALHELAPVDVPVAVLVVELEDALVDVGLGQLRHGTTSFRSSRHCSSGSPRRRFLGHTGGRSAEGRNDR